MVSLEHGGWGKGHGKWGCYKEEQRGGKNQNTQGLVGHIQSIDITGAKGS